MGTVRAWVLAATVGVLALGVTPAAAQETPRPKVGELHPEVRLPTIDRERTISLSGLRGKKVLLIEFASW